MVTRDKPIALPAENIPSSPAAAAAMAPPLLLQGENAADYADLTAKILAGTQPKDFIEELFARDVIDLTWEIFRLRRLKAGVLRATADEGVKHVLLSLESGKPTETVNFSGPWRNGQFEVRKERTRVLAETGLTMDDAIARGLPIAIDTLERVDRMLASAETRRNNTLREIEGHREELGRAVRAAIEAEREELRNSFEGGKIGAMVIV